MQRNFSKILKGAATSALFLLYNIGVIKDNDNKDYVKEATASVSSVDYLVYKDCMNTCTGEEYDKAWNRICSAFTNQNNLLESWYIDGDLQEI